MSTNSPNKAQRKDTTNQSKPSQAKQNNLAEYQRKKKEKQANEARSKTKNIKTYFGDGTGLKPIEEDSQEAMAVDAPRPNDTNLRQSASDDTTPTSNKSPATQPTAGGMPPVQPTWSTRVDFRVMVDATDDPDIMFANARNAFYKLLKNFSEDDPTLMIRVWKEEDEVEYADIKPSDLPTSNAGMKRYWKNFRPSRTKGNIYGGVQILHSKAWATLYEEIEWMLSPISFGVWPCVLQVPDIVELGWLLYSTLQMDAKAYSKALSDALDVDIGVKYKAIFRGRGQKAMAKAMHVYCDARQEASARAAFNRIYSSRSKSFPLNTKMRAVPTFMSLHTNSSQSNALKAMQRQQKFEGSVVKIQSWRLLSLTLRLRKLTDKPCANA